MLVEAMPVKKDPVGTRKFSTTVTMAENDYDQLNHGKCGTQWRNKEDQHTDSMYGDLNLTQSRENPGVYVSCKRSEGKRLTPSSGIVAIVVTAAVILFVIISATLVVLLIRTSQTEKRLKSLLKSLYRITLKLFKSYRCK